MCLLSVVQKAEVERTLREFLVKGAPFTGWDIVVALRDEQADPAYAQAAAPPPREVSPYVRQLYNSGWFPEGWGSQKVRAGGKDALQYFPVPPRSVAGIAAAKLRRAMAKP